MNNKGFTLAELICCVAILGVIALAAGSLQQSAVLVEKQAKFSGYQQPVLSLMQTLSKDIHRAQSLDAVEPSRMVLKIDGRPVEWLSGKNTIFRKRGALRQTWRFTKGVSFRETQPGTVEVFFPSPSLYSYVSVGGGIR